MREMGFSDLIKARKVLSRPIIELPIRNEERLFYHPEKRLKRFAGHTAIAYAIIPDSERGKFRREECSPKASSLRDYILHKGNRNVSITGVSGQGKSYLTTHLISIFGDKEIIIFSFKPNDHELHLGIPVIDAKECLPNPFSDVNAFSEAYITAFFGERTSSGIQLQQTPGFLQEIASESDSWKDFMLKLSERKRSASKNQVEALNAIEQNVKSLIIEDMGRATLGNGSTVFDFSSLPTKQAQNFYAELMLRQIYREMEERRRNDVLILIDEAHRLTKSYHTILDVMSREIRDKGMLSHLFTFGELTTASKAILTIPPVIAPPIAPPIPTNNQNKTNTTKKVTQNSLPEYVIILTPPPSEKYQYVFSFSLAFTKVIYLPFIQVYC